MYDYIKGIITTITPVGIVVDNNGIGYFLHVANPFSYSSYVNQESIVYCYQAVREDAITLYGFKTNEQRELFLKLISVSGIGPKSALSILASGDNEGLISAIENNNVGYLTKFPGVGKKTAGQLVLDLKGKFVDVAPTQQVVQVASPIFEQAKEGLLALGYSAKEIDKIMPTLEKQTFETTADVLNVAFKLLLGKS